MPKSKSSRNELKIHPLVAKRWEDFKTLFGPRGACGGCWCMWWRLTRSQFEQRKGGKNRRAMKRIVDSGRVPGLLAYEGSRPVAWCSIAPREDFPVLDRSRILKRVDEEPVWSIVCFFVVKDRRRKGITVRILKGAVEYARNKGARIVEGYPVEPKKPDAPGVFAFTGFASAFEKAGFREVLRRSDTRPIMRYYLR